LSVVWMPRWPSVEDVLAQLGPQTWGLGIPEPTEVDAREADDTGVDVQAAFGSLWRGILSVDMT
jgi:hypothetical protein